MTLFSSDVNSLWAVAAAVCAAIAITAWTLQMACGFCSIEPPTYTHAVFVIVVVIAANVLLHAGFSLVGMDDGPIVNYLAPLAAVSAIVSLSVPTNPLTAITITIVQVTLSALLYFFAGWCAHFLTMSVYV